MTNLTRTLLLPSLLLLAANAATAAEYQIIDLGPLEGGVGSNALGTNDQGDVVGVSYVNMNGNIASSLPVRWSAAGGVDKLWEGDGIIQCRWDDDQSKFVCDPLQYRGGIPLGINNQGWIVGRSQTNPYDGVPLPMLGLPEGMAFLWDPVTGRKQDLGSLGGANSTAAGLNDAGQVAGTAQLVLGASRGPSFGTRQAECVI